MIIDFIEENKSIVNTLIKSGVISYEFAYQLERYIYYTDAVKISESKGDALKMTMNKFRCCRKTIYNNIKIFEAEL